MKRLLIYSHFNRHGELSNHVLYQLQHMNTACDSIIFVSNSPLKPENRAAVLEYCDEYFERENVGYDFMAWKETVQRMDPADLLKYDSLILMNDTSFGPLFGIDTVFAKMDPLGLDLWGITSHCGSATGMPGDGGPIPYHIQSYFTVFSRRAFTSKCFIDFWDGIKVYSKVDAVIRNCETRLTSFFIDQGFKVGCFVDIGNRKLPMENYATFCPDVALDAKSPLVKVKAFQFFADPHRIKRMIEATTDYPIDFIEDHINRTDSPNISPRVNSKTFIPATYIIPPTASLQKVGIHIHVTDVMVFQRILERLPAANPRFDFYISVDSKEKEAEIQPLILSYIPNSSRVQTIVFEIRGNDVLPWHRLGKSMSRYEIACYLHARATGSLNSKAEDSGLYQILEDIVSPAEKIVGLLDSNPSIGIVIPDFPYCFHAALGARDPWQGHKSITKDLWNRLGCTKALNWADVSIPVFPYAYMFWYRPAALRPLLNLDFKDSDFSAASQPPEVTLIDAMEKIPVYLAWNQGYDYRISRGNLACSSRLEFILHSEIFRTNEVSEIRKKLESIQNSRTWRLRSALVDFIWRMRSNVLFRRG